MHTRARTLVVIGLVTTFFLGITVPLLIQWVEGAGHAITSVQSIDEYLLAWTWAVGLGILLTFFQIPWEIKKHILWIWGLRCFVTLFLMLFYEQHYNLDAYEYFHNIVRRSYTEDFLFGRGSNFTVWLGVILNDLFYVGDSYHTYKVIWSFFGLLAIIPFYNLYHFATERHNPMVIWIVGAFPSSLFWTSILGKDPLALLGIGCFCYGLMLLARKVTLQAIFYTATGLLLLLFIRYWLVGIFLLPATLTYAFVGSRHIGWRTASLVLSICALAIFLNRYSDIYMYLVASDAIESLNQISSSWSKGGSSQLAPTFGGYLDVAAFLPIGILTALFRPLPGEVLNAFGTLAGIENLFVIWIFAGGIRKFRKHLWANPIVFYFIGAILIWSIFYAFLSYQNLGTAVRFRAQILPLMLMLPYIIKALTSSKAPPIPSQPGHGSSPADSQSRRHSPLA